MFFTSMTSFSLCNAFMYYIFVFYYVLYKSQEESLIIVAGMEYSRKLLNSGLKIYGEFRLSL